MLENGVDLVVAFPGGAATRDMVKRARAAGVEIFNSLSTKPASGHIGQKTVVR